MKTLSRNKIIGVSVVFVVVFNVLLFGNYFFKQSATSGTDSKSGQAAAAAVGAGIQAPQDLKVEDMFLGTGEAIKSGDTVSIHYTGILLDGTKFDSSYDRGEPIIFTVGSGQLIAGFDQGVLGMKVGGKRKLTIPPELGYGAQATGAIPANSTIVFDVALVEIVQ